MPANVTSAISPYIARTKKAIEFFEANEDKTSQYGLFMCIAGGPGDETDWPGGVVPLPSLETTQLQYVKGFKRYDNMYFVVPDTGGNINVGGITWSKVSLVDPPDPNVWMSRYTNVLQQKSRWIFIDATLRSGEADTASYKQVGLYSNLKILDGYDFNKEFYTPEEISKTGTDVSNYIYDGILEIYQNKDTLITRSSELTEYFAWVLEF
jgi:hypothetical protein